MQQAGMASSECSSGCQSGWTTYLDDDEDRSSGGTKRQFHFHAKAAQQPQYHCHDYWSEEDDLSMISDASSGPRHQQQCSAGNGDAVQAGAANSAAERRARRAADAASARRQSKKAAAAALLEDTASSPAFFKTTSLFGEANAYGADADEAMMEIGNAAEFSCAFSATTTTTGFKSSFNGTALDGYLQMQYSPAAAKPTMMPTTRQVCRDAGETTKRW